MKTKNCIPLFLKDHEQVLVHIQELEQYVDEFRHKGYSSRRGGQFIKALDTLDHEVRVHHAVEENPY